MDENPPRSPVDEGSDPIDGRHTGSDRLVNRLVEMRGELDLVAPEDQQRGREAIERMLELQDRVATFDAMLATARKREHDLTMQLVRDRTLIAGYEARIAELSAIAVEVSSADELRRQAEGLAVERARALAVARSDVEAARTETERLRARCAELEADLHAVADDVAAGTIARAGAARLERERDEARQRAESERSLAARDRRRAEEAEARARDLQAELRAAEGRIIQASPNQMEEASRLFDAATPAPPEPPRIAPQPALPKPALRVPGPARQTPDTSSSDPRIIDLTDEGRGNDRAARDADRTPSPDEVPPQEGTWAASSSDEGLLDKLLHPRRHR